MSDKEIYEKREKEIKEILDLIEKDKVSFHDYQIMVEILEVIKRSSISDINEKRNDMSIIGLAAVIRGYENLIADPRAPYDKFRFRDELKYLFDLIHMELEKPSSFKHSQQEIHTFLRKLWGKEDFKSFCKRYKIHDISLPVENMKYLIFACFLFVLIFLLIIIFFNF